MPYYKMLDKDGIHHSRNMNIHNGVISSNN